MTFDHWFVAAASGAIWFFLGIASLVVGGLILSFKDEDESEDAA